MLVTAVLVIGFAAGQGLPGDAGRLIELAEIRRMPSLLDEAERLLDAAEAAQGVGAPGRALRARLLFARSETVRAGGDRRVADRGLDEAIAQAEAALKLDPSLPTAHAVLLDLLGRKIDLGGFLTAMRHGGRLGAAVERAEKLGQSDVDLLLAIGRNRLQTPPQYGGNEARAVERFREAASLDPRRATAHFWLGRGLARLGRYEEAAVHYGRALELEPGYVDARIALDRLRGR